MATTKNVVAVPTSDLPISSPSILSKHDNALQNVRKQLVSDLTDAKQIQKIAVDLHETAKQCSANSKDLLTRSLIHTTVHLLKSRTVSPANETTTTDETFQHVLKIIDVSIELKRLGFLDDKTTFTLLEYLFTFSTQQQICTHINDIRQRCDTFRHIGSPKSKKLSEIYNIKLVQSCITRDPRGTNAILSGRLRLMLAAALPVWHASGMNCRGTYNTGRYGMDCDALLSATDDVKVDVSLYKAFWACQDLMQNPSLSEVPTKWEEARICMCKVLSAFDTVPVSTGSPDPITCHKYLTSPTILRLQLVDARVRRHVLVQYAIFLHHLEVVGTSAAPRAEEASGTAVKGPSFCKQLFSPRGEGEVLKARVYMALEKECAGKYKRFVQGLLVRERRWIDWKKRKSYNQLSEVGSAAPKKFKRRAVMSVPGKSDANNLTTGDWSSRKTSWAAVDRMQRDRPLKVRSRIWGVEELKAEIEEDENDGDIEEQEKRKHDGKYAWRALRLLCEESVECMAGLADHSSTGFDLERMIKVSNTN